MFLAALIIGVITAYYFGLRHGVTAAGVSVGLFVVALFLPGYALWIYGSVAAGVGAMLLVGPRMPGREKNKHDLLIVSRRLMARGLGLVRRWNNRDQGR